MNTPSQIQKTLAPFAEPVVELFRGSTYATRIVPGDGDSYYLPAGRKGIDGVRELLPYRTSAAVWHLNGARPAPSGFGFRWVPVRHGVYPLVNQFFCWFVAADIDNHSTEDPNAIRKLVETCWRVVEVGRKLGIKVHLERSAGGNGVHLWIFFSEPVTAANARRLLFRLFRLAEILTEIEVPTPRGGVRRALSVVNSGGAEFDKLFPAQDSLKPGKLGNLVAIPYNGVATWHSGRSVMLDLGPGGKLPSYGSWPIVRLSQLLKEPGRVSNDEMSQAIMHLLDLGVSDEPPGTRPASRPTKNRMKTVRLPNQGGSYSEIDWETFLDEQDEDSLLTVSHKTDASAILMICPYCGNSKSAWISLKSGWLNCWHKTCDACEETGIPPSEWSEDLDVGLPRKKRGER